jgi:NTE family protein
VRIRRALFIVVDAAQGPGGNADLQEEGPSGIDVAFQASAAAVDASARLAADTFRAALKELQESVIAWRCSLTREEARALGATDTWRCADIRFSFAFLSIDGLDEPHRTRIAPIPTRLTLGAADVDAMIEAARAGLALLPQLREYLADRNSSLPRK